MVYNPELRYYFEREITEEKHYGCVLNAVKFKLVLRMFAVVRNTESMLLTAANMKG